MADIKQLAARRAETGLWLQSLGIANTPDKIEDQIKSAAQYALAQAAYTSACRDFDSAIHNLTTDELIALTRDE